MTDMPVESVRPIREPVLKSICDRVSMVQVSGPFNPTGRFRRRAKSGAASKALARMTKVEREAMEAKIAADDALAAAMLPQRKAAAMLTDMIVAIKADYETAVKYAQLRYMLHVLDDTALASTCERLRLPALPPVGPEDGSAPRFGKLQLPKFPFAKRAKRISNTLYIFDPNVASCIKWPVLGGGTRWRYQVAGTTERR